MGYSWRVFGHQKQRELLAKTLDLGRIAHAYIFSGPEHVGKKQVALNLALILVCENLTGCGTCNQCKAFISGTNADIIQISGEEPVKIEQIRKLSYALSLKPYLAKYKVAVVDNADSMTVEAQNALLKLMEEPKPYTVIILITANQYRLLPTILSRGQKINFGFVDESDYDSMLSEIDDSEKESLRLMALGRPGLLQDILNDQEKKDNLGLYQRQAETFISGDEADKLRLASDLSQAETSMIKSSLNYWLAIVEKKLKTDGSSHSALQLDKILIAIKHLEANVNTKLLLTDLMLENT